MKIKYIFFTLSLLLIYSCGTYRINKTSGFVPLTDLQQLNGKYITQSQLTNKNKNLSYLLQHFNINNEKADFANLTFEEPNQVKLDYIVDSKEGAVEKKIVLEGSRKKKYLEIYFSKEQSFIPLLYSKINVQRIRIGKDKNGELLIMNFYDRSGNVLFLGAGSSFERGSHFKKSIHYTGLMPVCVDKKWGYVNAENEIVIPAKYDFVYLFNHNAAKVKLDNKWGLITASGTEIASLEYDVIKSDFIYQKYPIYLVEKNTKMGMLDTLGHQIVPPIYDKIDRLYNAQFRIKYGDNYGFGTKEKIIIPAIYSDVEWFSTEGYVVAKRNNTTYLVDLEGFEYETELYNLHEIMFKNQTHRYKPILASKRKINFEEQFAR